MGKQKQKVMPEQFSITLSEPGMTVLHKVGLAGLWMTLRAFEQDQQLMRTLPSGAGWRLDERSVTLVPGPQPKAFFDWLIAQSFRLDENGLFWFPALGRPADNIQDAVVRQRALLGTFLQHVLSRSADRPSKPTGRVNVEIDDRPLVLTYSKVNNYAHQKQDIDPVKPVRLVGWCLPGGTERHTIYGETRLTETPIRALALRFALVGAVCFEIKTSGRKAKSAYSLVLPEVTSLERYARARSRFLKYGIKQLYVAGGADAGMRVLAELYAAGLVTDLRSTQCRVMSFDTVPWVKQQKTRVEVFVVRAATETGLMLYQKCINLLPSRLVPRDGAEPFSDVPLLPDLVAKNIRTGRAWYEGFAELVADKGSWRHVSYYERGGLSKMVRDNAVMPEGPERIFVLACQEALRRRMGQKYSRPGGANWGAEYEKVRVSIARCKNAAALRETIVDLWSRGGALHRGEKTLLAAGDDWWQQVMPLFDDKNWRRARDLALLALASYPAGGEQKDTLTETEGEAK